MVWRDGVVPEGGPPYGDELTADLLDFGYSVLAQALELRDTNRDAEQQLQQPFETSDAFAAAAQAIESAVRRGDATDGDHGRHLVICSAAYHLAGYAAQSYSLLPESSLDRNLASIERALALLLRRDLVALRSHIVRWLEDEEHSDEALARRLEDEDDPFDPHEAAYIALASSYYRALGTGDTSLMFGTESDHEASMSALDAVIQGAASVGNIAVWWVATLTQHLFRDLRDNSLHVRLPPDGDGLPDRWGELRSSFIARLLARQPPHIELWPSQLDAARRSLDPNDDLVIALPTSAGKTRIAELCILRTLADARRTIYITPLRALSAQVERVLAHTFVPLGESVTSLYGAAGATGTDTDSLANETIVVATPEKLDFALRQDPMVINDVGLVVFDEGHMIGLGSREIRYEVLIQRLLRRKDVANRRIVCLSAMFNGDDPYFKDFNEWLRSDAPGSPVHVRWRPTRQRFATVDWYERERGNTARLRFLEKEEAYVPNFFDEQPVKGQRKNPFPQNDLEFCIASADAFARDGHSVLIYSPQRSQVEPLVRAFSVAARQDYLAGIKPPTDDHISIALAIGREWLGNDHDAIKGLKVGVGSHHGALPRPFLAAIESLLDKKRLRIVVASPTLAQGIDLSCSVLLFRSLTRYDSQAEKHVAISPAEFANVAGRAGRAFVDLDGLVVLPTFEASKRRARHAMFADLHERSEGQRLQSGLAQLVLELSARISSRLRISGAELLEYVVNQHDLWNEASLTIDDTTEEDEDNARSLIEYFADLDVAILSLVEKLDAPIARLAKLLDAVLTGSLWGRTLAHKTEPERNAASALLLSRAKWLWRNTDPAQRTAFYVAGLGSQPGRFLYDRLDVLIEILASLQSAVIRDDNADVAKFAVAFAEALEPEPYFFVKSPPTAWRDVLTRWTTAVGFSDILQGRPMRDAQRTQAFIQDGVIFKLVWAAEAVRVMAVAAEHSRAEELGDGPAFTLTYGVPNIAAALLCQAGFASRVGALWVTRELETSFIDNDGMRAWLTSNGSVLFRDDFWGATDHALLWKQVATSTNSEAPRTWKRESHLVAVRWNGDVPAEGTRVRLMPRGGRSATVCTSELQPIGSARLPFNIAGTFCDAVVSDDEGINVDYFGR
jgi:hypothetical protein|nr:DEAD/DEAH box helicase [Kofleriaceae bacterium]